MLSRCSSKRRVSLGTATIFCVIASGCLDFGDDITTEDPTVEQLAFCENAMHLNDELQYEPIGFKIVGSGIDDAVWFSFHTDETDLGIIFDAEVVPFDSLRGSVDIYTPEDMPLWWDIQGKGLVGGSITLPAGRSMTVGMNREEAGTSVYIFWHES